MTAKIRSSFLFKRHSQQPNATPLYEDAISRVDTRSFANLFNQYESSAGDLHPSLSALSNLSGIDVTTGKPTNSTPVVKSPESDNTMTALPIYPKDRNLSMVIRNDSTGSSSSLSKDSDGSPRLSRHSSSSSIGLDPILPLWKDGTPKSNTAPSRRESCLPRSTPSSPVTTRTQQSRSDTGKSTISIVSEPPNLDKPLPLGPAAKGPNSHHPRKKHVRSTSVTFSLDGELTTSIPELPSCSARSSRGARLGKAMMTTESERRSKSTMLVDFTTDSQSHRRSKYEHRTSYPHQQSKPPITKRRRDSSYHSKNPISANTAEKVIYRIMCHIDDIRDLKSTAMVSKGFLNTYRRNESKLLSHLIFKNSRPAWELRRSILTLRGSKTFRLNDYQRDLNTLRALKSCIVVHCGATCKAKTIAGLQGQDAQCEVEVDNALWRIWTYCALFGANAERSPASDAEIDWLNGSKGTNSKALGAGFGIGNRTGLSVDELEDMSEMWICLQTLVSQFHGRENEAKRVGVFDNFHLNQGSSEQQHLEEWTAYLLTLGPQVVLPLSSGLFDRAKTLGSTKWTVPAPGQTRSSFLTAAIAHVYQEHILTEATAKAAQITLAFDPRCRPNKTYNDLLMRSHTVASRQQSLRIDTANVHSHGRAVSTQVLQSAPAVEIRPDCDPASIAVPTRSLSQSPFQYPTSPTNDPSAFYTLSMTPTISTRLGATLFPVDYSSPVPHVPFLQERRHGQSQPQRQPCERHSTTPCTSVPESRIIDPIDKAMNLLVSELGFKEPQARRALAMCDSGSGIDVAKAIELLAIESRDDSTQRLHMPVELPTPADLVAPIPQLGRRLIQKREYCEGHSATEGQASTAAGEKRRSSLRIPAPSLITSRHSHMRNVSETTTDVPISPVTDIYAVSSSDDDDREAREAENDTNSMMRERSDTVSPLLSPMNMNRLSGLSLSRATSLAKTNKAWKVLGVERTESKNGKKSGKAKKKVLGIEEYEKRVVERRKSLRMQLAQQEGVGKAVFGLGVGVGLGGLGGLRVVDGGDNLAGKRRGVGCM